MVLADGETHRPRDVSEAVSDSFGLTAQERAQLIPSEKQSVMYNRVTWALSYLFQAGLTERPERGHVRIAQLGRTALEANPDRIDMKVLEQYPAYLEFKTRTKERAAAGDSDLPAIDTTSTPQDLLERAIKENRAVTESELLKRALALPPVGFEDLVMRLLGAMGYGTSGRVERTSASGDAGIDGIISQDPLGLDRIYVQAKRHEAVNVIHRPTVQAFVGALVGAQGDRGVFLTTSSFSAGARLEAERVAFRIELIDGLRLAQLMLRHGVGVQPETTVTLYQLDEDFFERL